MSPRWESKPEVRRGRTVVNDLHVHLVFVTVKRGEILSAPMLATCEQVMRDVCTDFTAELREFNGHGDYVHVLVHYLPTMTLSRLVGSLKTVSSRLLRDARADLVGTAGDGEALWSPSYFAGTCGGDPVSVISDFIAQLSPPLPT